jgi:hypothetical protein
MIYNLFIDDVRLPKDAFLYGETKMLCDHSGINPWLWVVVRNYDDFVKTIEEKGIPDNISFDCDLSMEHMKHYMNHTRVSGVYEWENFKNKCGIHCANYLKRLLSDSNLKPKVYIHSANEVGRRIIKEILKDYV